MFKIFTTLLLAAALVNAAPVADQDDGKRAKPANYQEGYLEKYDVYHCRYVAINCKNQHGTKFFDDCCHPMLATETLAKNRKEYCDPANHPAPETQYRACQGVAGAPTPANPSPPSPAPPSGDNGDDDEEDCPDDEPAAPIPLPAVPAPAPAPPSTPAPSGGDNGGNGGDSNNGGSSNNGGNSNNGGGGGGGAQHSGGFATFFFQNGNAGNCGNFNPDSAFLAALPSAIYDNGAHCGQHITLTNTNNGKSVTVVVADSCPFCINNDCLDLSQAAFDAIADESEGMVPITWSYV